MITVRRLVATTLLVLGVSFLAASPAGATTRPRVLESAPFSQAGTFSHPTGVAIDQETGNVYVADSATNTVDVFGAEGGAPTGEVPSQITGLAFAGSEPEAVAVDNACFYQHLSGSACEAADPSNGDVYIAESEAQPEGAIGKYALNGAKEYELVATLSVAGQPNGVAIDAQGNVYIAVYQHQEIEELTSSGAEVAKIHESLIAHPAYLAVEDPGTMYVGNYGGGVAKLEIDAGHEAEHEELAPEGQGTGQGADRAIAVDGHGTAYLDYGSYIAGYASSREFGTGLLEEFSLGSSEGSQGVAVNDKSGYVYVTDPTENSLAVFGSAVVAAEAITGPALEMHAAGGGIAATLTGNINPGNTSITGCLFEYGENASSEHTASCIQPLPLTGESGVPVSAAVSGLEADTVYRYRLLGENSGGALTGGELTFTTLALPPTVNDRAPAVASASRTGAVIDATIDDERNEAGYFVEYAEAAAYQPGQANPYSDGGATKILVLGAGRGDQAKSIEVTDLRPGTTYDYRLVATNHIGTEYGPDYTFTTAAATPPGAITGAAEGVTQTTATLSGLVNPEGSPTSYAFQIGPSIEYGTVIAGSAGDETGEQAVATSLQGLAPATVYHYRLLATSADGTTYGADQTFTTGGFAYPPVQPAAIFPNLSALTPTPAPKTVKQTSPKPLSSAQKLAKALVACKRDKIRKRRDACERTAKKKYRRR